MNEDHLNYIHDMVEDHCFEQAADEIDDLLDREDVSADIRRQALVLAKICARSVSWEDDER